MASLNAILKTGAIRVPRPIRVRSCFGFSAHILTVYFKVLDSCKGSSGAMLVMEYMDLKSLGSNAYELGERVARLESSP